MSIINCIKLVDKYYFIFIILHVLYAMMLICERLNNI